MKKTKKKVDYHIAIWGLIAIALASVLGDETSMASALVGAMIGLVNWTVFKNLTKRVETRGNQMSLGLWLALKFLALVGIITAIFFLTPVQPVAFTAGVSALFLGITSYNLFHYLKNETSAVGGED